MEIGKYADGGKITYSETDETFAIDASHVSRETLAAYDAKGEVAWDSDDTAAWFRNLKPRPGERTGAARPGSRSPLTVIALALFVLIALTAGAFAFSRAFSSPTPSRNAASGAQSPQTSLATSAAAPDSNNSARPSSPEPKPQKPASQPQAASQPAPETELATVVRVVDGDTAVFRLPSGKDEKVRFIGIDTPESTNEHEPFGEEASAYTHKVLSAGKHVYLERDVEARDRYGRLLAYIWLSEPADASESTIRAAMFNAQLALDGYAQQMTIPPNVKYASYFKTFVAEARSADKGLWGDTPAASPGSSESKPAAPAANPPSNSSASKYIGNRRSMKFHYPNCRGVAQMSEHNKVALASRTAAVAAGYVPCKICNP